MLDVDDGVFSADGVGRKGKVMMRARHANGRRGGTCISIKQRQPRTVRHHLGSLVSLITIIIGYQSSSIILRFGH
jgi:hypothetical protein